MSDRVRPKANLLDGRCEESTLAAPYRRHALPHSKVSDRIHTRVALASPCLTIVGRSAFVYNDIHFRIVTTSLLFVVSLAASGARGGGFLRILRALSTFCATSDPFVTTR